MSKLDKIFLGILFISALCVGGMEGISERRLLPNFSPETTFFIGVEGKQEGRLMAFDPQTKEYTALSSSRNIINQFTLFSQQDKHYIIFLSVPKSKTSSQNWSIDPYQKLFELELETGKIRPLPNPYDLEFHQSYGAVGKNLLILDASQKNPPRQSLWKYDFRKRVWSPLYKSLQLQNVTFSLDGYWLLGVNPLKNFGFTLFPISEDMSQSKPIGNYSRNFGFSADGKRILFSQKPDQDIFSDQEYLLIFQADGTAIELFKNGRSVIQATWGEDSKTIYAVVQSNDKDDSQTLLKVNIDTQKEDILTQWKKKQVNWMKFKKGKLWIVTDSQDLSQMDHDEGQGIQDMLNAFSAVPKTYETILYDPQTDTLSSLPVKGFLPQQF